MVNNFSKNLVDWYARNLRDLPWRNTQNSYRIWLSEIILQQTRVIQGLPYYLKFIEKYPTVLKLAKAKEEEILKLWEGLGYYSRARNLHKAAIMVVEKYNGEFPTSYNNLIKLKGVGVYTASAVASFSSNEAVAVVDGNVYRVLSRIFGVFTPINSSEGQKEFKKIADSLLDTSNSANHNQAIMEFGALCCTPKKPKCLTCPFLKDCYSFNNNTIDILPIKLKKTKITIKYFFYLIIKVPNNTTYISRREKKGIWKHLYEFPLVVSEINLSSKQIIENFSELLSIEIPPNKVTLIKKLDKPHKLSHQHIYTTFFEYQYNGKIISDKFSNVAVNNLDNYPFPVLISNFKENYKF